MPELTFLTKLATVAGGTLVCGFFGIVLLKIVTGEIPLAHLLKTADFLLDEVRLTGDWARCLKQAVDAEAPESS